MSYRRLTEAEVTPPNRGWFFVVDAGGGRLLQSIAVPPGRLHVEQRASISRRGVEHERSRPSPLTGKAGNSYASTGHEAEEELQRFAREVAEWLEQKIARYRIGSLALFAPPRFLGALRKTCNPRLASHFDIHQADLAGWSASNLAHHPVVEELPPGGTDDRWLP